MVSSQGRAAAASLSASRDRQARSSDSCTMSSAIERSRASQCAKRTRSGRSDSNSCDSGACGCNADSRSVIEETGDSGGELRMDAAVPRACDYGMHAAVPWQYRAEAPGLLGQRLFETRTGASVNFLIRWLID